MNDMQLQARDEALKVGHKRYFTGKPCKRGHIAERFVYTCNCVACASQTTKIRYQTDKDFRERSIASGKQHYRKKSSACLDDTYKQHLAKMHHMWLKKNVIKWRDYCKQWNKNNPGMIAHYANMRRAAKLRATPRWANIATIQAFYVEAKRLTKQTGIQHTVDHIVPLRGKTVCGLHVENNLQILTKSENSSKNNKVLQ